MRSRVHAHIRANVVGYIAIFMFAIGGTAYATHPGGANTISTEDIINGQVQTPDLGAAAVTGSRLAGNSVNASKVVNNSLTGGDVNEPSLDLGSHLAAESGSQSACTDDDENGDVCASAPISLDQPGQLLVNATGGWHTHAFNDGLGPGSGTDETDAVHGRCMLRVDGNAIGLFQDMGEESSETPPPGEQPAPNHPSPHRGTMALTALSLGLGAGPHTADVFCTEIDGDMDWQLINLTVIRADD